VLTPYHMNAVNQVDRYKDKHTRKVLSAGGKRWQDRLADCTPVYPLRKRGRGSEWAWNCSSGWAPLLLLLLLLLLLSLLLLLLLLLLLQVDRRRLSWQHERQAFAFMKKACTHTSIRFLPTLPRCFQPCLQIESLSPKLPAPEDAA